MNPEETVMKGPARHHATSEKTFEPDETEFLIAMDSFKRRTGKQFPTLCDTLDVIRSLGYSRQSSLLAMDEALAC